MHFLCQFSSLSENVDHLINILIAVFTMHRLSSFNLHLVRLFAVLTTFLELLKKNFTPLVHFRNISCALFEHFQIFCCKLFLHFLFTLSIIFFMHFPPLFMHFLLLACIFFFTFYTCFLLFFNLYISIFFI